MLLCVAAPSPNVLTIRIPMNLLDAVSSRTYERKALAQATLSRRRENTNVLVACRFVPKGIAWDSISGGGERSSATTTAAICPKIPLRSGHGLYLLHITYMASLA